jgi:hypothetical protein
MTQPRWSDGHVRVSVLEVPLPPPGPPLMVAVKVVGVEFVA